MRQRWFARSTFIGRDTVKVLDYDRGGGVKYICLTDIDKLTMKLVVLLMFFILLLSLLFLLLLVLSPLHSFDLLDRQDILLSLEDGVLSTENGD